MAELKNLKKGDTVILHMFTGIAVGVKEVIAADAKTVTLETRIGTAKFSKKTGIQVEPAAKAERFANFITEDDGSFVPPERKGKKLKKEEKPVKKTKKPAESEEDETDEEEIPAPAKVVSKKAAKKTAPKNAKKEEESEDDEDFDEGDYEEVE